MFVCGADGTVHVSETALLHHVYKNQACPQRVAGPGAWAGTSRSGAHLVPMAVRRSRAGWVGVEVVV